MAKILVVDDVMYNVKLLAYNLADDGYEVLTANSGQQALAIAKSDCPDVVLLDIMMPEMDGIEVCKRMQQDPELRVIPVIMVSALDQEENIIAGLDAGACDYVKKPFLWPIVAARVRSAVRIKTDHDRIEEMNHRLEQARLEAENVSAAKTEFLANMSHEIRTPMTAIMGFAENLLDDELTTDERDDAVETIHRNGQVLLEIINDILDLAKIEARKLTIEKIRCSPTEIIARLISLMQVRADEKEIALSVQYSGAIPQSIETDPTRLQQILLNLIGNALKFTDAGSVRLEISLVDSMNGRDTEPVLQFDVHDTGVGMRAEKTKNLFQQFSQEDSSTTRRFGGSGLGLVISKRLAGMLGGDVELVTTQLGQGSHFRATVLTGDIEDIDMLDDPDAATAIPASRRTHSKPKLNFPVRILLVEDGADNQRLISHILKISDGLVTTADNGKLGVDILLESEKNGEPFDVVLMDMQMPVMDGYQAVRFLRARGFKKPIIALTAHAMVGDRDKCLDVGCDEYVTKPVNRHLLIETVNHLVESPSSKPVLAESGA